MELVGYSAFFLGVVNRQAVNAEREDGLIFALELTAVKESRDYLLTHFNM